MSADYNMKLKYTPELLSFVSKQVENHIINDSKAPLLEEQLNCNVYPTVSGMNDFDYPTIPVTDGCNNGLEKQLTSLKRIPLPDELVEQFAHMQCNCVMGIFPEINRAWLSIDSDIYFWIYEDGSDVAYYDGIKEVILAAGLITPKPGVFQEHIKYLLCVTTPINIHIFGISFSVQNPFHLGHSHGSIQLHPEPLFTTSTDNVYMTSVCGTANGRIFLAGKDDSLYEVVYKVQSTWFSKKCFKVNHSASKISYFLPGFLSYVFSSDDAICQLAMDNSRSLLYCRTEKGDIKVYSLGDDMNEMHFIAAMNYSTISKHAQYVARTIDYCNFEKIAHLAPVPKTDSVHVHLVAMMTSGIRLYFTTSSSDDPYHQPNQLRLLHVRMPGGFAPSLTLERPTNVHTAFYRKGTSISVSSVSEGMDKLWCFSQDIFPFKTPLKETQSVVHIDGHTWCLTEIPDYSEMTDAPIHLFNGETLDLPSVVTEHVLSIRRFVLLSAQGSHIITTLRPIDQLRMLLHTSGTGESDSVAAFFRHYGADQACASCLILICQNLESESQLSDLASHAFFHYGNNVQKHHQPHEQRTGMNALSATSPIPMSSYIAGSPVPTGSSGGSFLSTPIPQTGMQYQAPTPAPPNLMNSTAVQQFPMSIDVQKNSFSPKLNGMFLYFSRIVRPLWNVPLVHQLQAGSQLTDQLCSRLSAQELAWFIKVLLQMKRFLDAHAGITLLQSPVRHQYAFTQLQSGDENTSNEKRGFEGFYQLLTLTIEALELWRILCEHNFTSLIDNLLQDMKARLFHLNFKEMFTPVGRELSTHLISSLLSTYFHDNSAVDSISAKLRSICPSLYSADDAHYNQANEILLSASLVDSQTEKERFSQEAIMIYSKIPDVIDLPWVCNNLRLNHCYNEIVQLCLTIALKRDPVGVGLYFYKSGEPREDVEGYEALSARRAVYTNIIETLEELSNYINSHPASSSVPNKPGPPEPIKETLLTQEMAKKYFHGMLANCLKSGDELFHVSLYQWFIKTKQTDILLSIKSTYLEQYLVASAAEQHPNNKNLLDLLWKYYEKNNNFLSAAKILLKLAEREGPTLTIQNRLEYLSRALISAKSCGVTKNVVADGEFLREIEEKLEVTQVQLKIFDQLSQKQMRGRVKDDALVQLNSKLFDISKLYGDFAEPFSLHECKLAIIHCAGHDDTSLVEKIWQEIIDKAFDDSQPLSVDDKMQSILLQLVQYGKTYNHYTQFFPINFLLYYLEMKSCENNFHTEWVFNIFKAIGTSYSTIFDSYISLHQTKDKIWQRLGKPFHLLKVISNVFSHFLENQTQTASERIALTRSLYESTTSFLVELESMNTYDTQVKDLLTKFKSIQAKLKRLL